MLRVSVLITTDIDCGNSSHCPVFSIKKQRLNIHVMLVTAEALTVMAKVYVSFLIAGS
jgi:hypothetical protein